MVELTINEIIEVFLVIILGVMILFFVVGGGGKMGPLWDKFCETFPQFCGGDATALEYEMATNSAEALTRAINCVIRGDSDCGSVSATEVAEMQTEATVSCREGDIQDLGEITFAAWGGETEAENYCRGSCGEEDCEISLAREGEVTFYVSQKEKTLVRCDCYCDGSQEGSVFGLVAEHAEQECGNKCVSGTAEVKNCHNFDVDLTKTGKESTMFYQDILKKKVEILPVVGKQCLCKNPGDESDNHHAYGTVPTSVIGMCAGGGYSGDTQDCSDFEGKLLFYKDDDIINMQKSSPKFRCEKTLQTVKCTIYDFSLPQKVSNVQEYVINYGDPAFMLYWNEFPIDENTWTFEPDWKVHALIAAISVFPLGKSLKVGAEIAWTAIKGPSKRLVAKVLAKDVVKEVGEDALVPIFGRTFTKELLSESSEDVIYNAFKKQIGKKELNKILKEYAKIVGKKRFTKIVMKEKLIGLLTERFRVKNIKSIVIKGVTYEAIYAAAIIADSMSENYVPHGNNMVLKSPYEDAELFELEYEWEDKPVIVKWEPNEVLIYPNAYNNAHLVSPCYLKDFEITRENVNCKRYVKSYDSTIGRWEYTCEVPVAAEPDKNAPACGVLDETIEDYLRRPVIGGGKAEGVYDKILGLLKMDDKKLFEHDENDNIKKIYLPLKSLETERDFYVGNISLKGETRRETSPMTYNTYVYDIYSAKFYGEDTPRDIEIECAIETRLLTGGKIDYEGGFCYIDLDNDDFPDIILERGVDEDTGETTRFTSVTFWPTMKMQPTWISVEFEDSEWEDVWDTLKLASGNNMIELSDIDSAGDYKYMSIGSDSDRVDIVKAGTGCDITGIVLDLTNLDDKKKKIDQNYCVRALTTGQSWTEFGIQAGTAVATVVSGFLTGGWSYVVLAGAAAIEAGAGIAADYVERWP